MPYIMFVRIPSLLRYTAVVKSDFRIMSTSILQINKSDSIVTRKMDELIIWYEQVTGMDEVRAAQNRVLEEEKKFEIAIERRREANKKVTDIQNKLREVYAELDNATRGEDRYVRLITEEHKLLKEERRLTEEFHQLEREEREHFSIYSSAVKESHEKERAQAERTKYWSVIASIVGTVIGVAGSSLNNHFRLKKLQQLVKETAENARLDSVHSIPELLSQQQDQLSKIIVDIKAITGLSNNQRLDEMLSKSSADKVENVIKLLNQQQTALQIKFKELEGLIKHTSGTRVTVPSVLRPEEHKSFILAGCTVALITFVAICLSR